MAVESQLPCNAFFREFRPNRAQPQRTTGDDDVLFHHPEVVNHLHILDNQGFPSVAIALSVDHPQSDLTCNNVVSSSSTRKRPSPMASDQMGLVQDSTITNPLHNLLAHRYPLPLQQSRLYGSAGTSTRGRPSVPSAPASTLSQDHLASLFCGESLEVEALLRLQAERLRAGLEHASKRQCRALLYAVEQQVSQRLRDKETELEAAARMNMELEEKVRMLSAENQIWFNVAKNNEAIASSLRNALEQVVLQNNTTCVDAAPPPGKEGYGDSDDVQSCCSENKAAVVEERTTAQGVVQWHQQKMPIGGEEEERTTMCKVCVEREVCVLVLPCRHLCLCKECEPALDVCPICCSTKNASLQIFLS